MPLDGIICTGNFYYAYMLIVFSQVSIQFGLKLDRTRTMCFPSFPKSYLEVHYLNEGKLNESETPFPYTLAQRMNTKQNSSYRSIRHWKPLVLDSFDLSCEQDLDATLKIELHQFGMSHVRLPYSYYYFTTTLRDILASQENETRLILPLWSSKGRVSINSENIIVFTMSFL